MGSQRSQRFAFGWDVSPHAARLTVLLCGLAIMTAARAIDAPDDGLLEFLGSVDTEDKAWHDYLARTDIDQVARRTGNPGGGNPSGHPVQPPAAIRPADPPPSPPSQPPSAPNSSRPTPPVSSPPAAAPAIPPPQSPPVSIARPPAGRVANLVAP